LRDNPPRRIFFCKSDFTTWWDRGLLQGEQGKHHSIDALGENELKTRLNLGCCSDKAAEVQLVGTFGLIYRDLTGQVEHKMRNQILILPRLTLTPHRTRVMPEVRRRPNLGSFAQKEGPSVTQGVPFVFRDFSRGCCSRALCYRNFEYSLAAHQSCLGRWDSPVFGP
jgi:hypothetical protein